MKKTYLLIISWLLISSALPAQPLQPAWTFPIFSTILGYDGTKPPTEVCHNFLDLVNQYSHIPAVPKSGNTYTVTNDQVNLVLNEIKNLYDPNELQVLFFPEGTYLMDDLILLNGARRNIVIRGEGSAKTIFKWQGADSHFISILGSLSNTTTSCWGTRTGWAIYLNANSPDFGNPGDIPEYALINHNNIPASECPRKGGTPLTRYTGQVCRVTGLSNNQDRLYVAHRLRKDFSNYTPRVQEMYPAFNNGIECIKIDGSGAGGDVKQFSHIYLENAVNCWIKGVESFKPKAQHVQVTTCSNIEVHGCYFHEAFDYGSGGHGYGVNLQTSTGECLIENNIFRYLRHAMQAQIGANGNGFLYNYSYEAKNNNVDLLLHGRWPFSNLFEGNVVERIEADQYHGRNGDYNIIFRNRTTEGRIKAKNGGYWWMSNCYTGTDRLAIVGNDVSDNINVDGAAHSIYDNFKNGSSHGNGYGLNNDNSPIGNSLVYASRPAWFPASQGSWPSIGPGSVGNNMIPARHRSTFSIKTTGGDCLSCVPAEPLQVTTSIDPCFEDAIGHSFPGLLNLSISGGTPPFTTVWTVLYGPALGTTSTTYAQFYGQGAYRAVVTDGNGNSQTVYFYPGPCEGDVFRKNDPSDSAPETNSHFTARAFPNPFSGSAKLRIKLPESGEVQIRIYSLSGQMLAEKRQSGLNSGNHTLNLPVEALAPGIYFAKIQFGQEIKTLKLIAE